MTRRLTGMAIVAAVALLGAACGQYPNVHERAYGAYAPGAQAGAAGAGGGAGLGGGGGGLGGGGGGLGSLGGGSTSGGGLSGGSGSGGGTFTSSGGGGSTSFGGGGGGGGGTSTNGGGSGASRGGGSGSGHPSGGSQPSGQTWGNTILIGIHAPITGAAPLRIDSFQTEKDLFFRYGNHGGPVTINGRKVQVIVEDDQYNPSHAQQVCQDMAHKGAFLLVGAAGTDQIVACAQYAASAGIPYMSGGVTQSALSRLGNYFALSMSYPQQASLLAQYIKSKFTKDCSQVFMIAEDTPNFDDAVSAWKSACPGTPEPERVPKSDNGGQYGAQLCTGTIPKYKVVYPLVSPVFFLQMAGAARGCAPQYSGVGISMGVDQVANTFCGYGKTGEAQFFSPAPAFHDSQKFDPGYVAAAHKAGISNPDDIGWLFWGLDHTLALLLQNAGKNLTQAGYVNATSHANISINGYGALHYSPSNHFGGSAVNALGNVCTGNGGYYVTLAANRTGF